MAPQAPRLSVNCPVVVGSISGILGLCGVGDSRTRAVFDGRLLRVCDNP